MSIKVTSREVVGESVYETTYEFSSYDEFNKWEKGKKEDLSAAIKGMFSLPIQDGVGDYPLPGEESFEESAVIDINVAKKPTKH